MTYHCRRQTDQRSKSLVVDGNATLGRSRNDSVSLLGTIHGQDALVFEGSGGWNKTTTLRVNAPTKNNVFASFYMNFIWFYVILCDFL